jgi:hypothetical protein
MTVRPTPPPPLLPEPQPSAAVRSTPPLLPASQVRGRVNPVGEVGPFYGVSTRTLFGQSTEPTLQSGRGIVRLNRKGFLQFKGIEVRGARDLSHLSEGTLRAMREQGFAATDSYGERLI